MSGIIAGYLPHLPPTPPPVGPETVRAKPEKQMGAPPKPVIVGELFGCWRIVERTVNHPKGVQVIVECAYCGARATRVLAYLRREPPNTHNGCEVNKPLGAPSNQS
jgi:hypothetical protein